MQEHLRAFEHQFRRSLLQSPARIFGQLALHAVPRAQLLYATHVLLNELDQEEHERRRAPPADSPRKGKGGGQRSAARPQPCPSCFATCSTCAINTWRDFNSQALRRYRETRLPDGRAARAAARAPARLGARAAGLVAKLALVWFAYEVLCHSVFAKMLWKRAQFQAFASGELLALIPSHPSIFVSH